MKKRFTRLLFMNVSFLPPKGVGLQMNSAGILRVSLFLKQIAHAFCGLIESACRLFAEPFSETL